MSLKFFPISCLLFDVVLDYPIVSIEDPFDKEDWKNVKHFSSLGICQVCPSYSLFLEDEETQNLIKQRR